MKTIGEQKILIIWLKESNKKQKNVEEEMVQGMIKSWEEALSYLARWTIFGSLNMVFCSTRHPLSNKK